MLRRGAGVGGSFAEMRGKFVSLEGTAARRPAQGCRVAEQRPLAAGWEDVPWRTCFARPWRSGRLEQALGELHAAELSFEFATLQVHLRESLQLALLDARAAIGAIAKGRSSVWLFLCVLRRVAALSFVCGIQWCPRWIMSEEQPDAGSRLYAPAPVVLREFDSTLGYPEEGPGEAWRPLRGGRLARQTMIIYYNLPSRVPSLLRVCLLYTSPSPRDS